MAFSLVATYDVSGSTNLTNGAPFRLESAEGLSGAPIIRHQQGGPLQNAAVDLGFRLAPRLVKLNLNFYATTDAALDTHRDTLNTTFKPSYTITLVATRDDGSVRYLTCTRVGEIEIDLIPEHRPGHLHRAVVTLRAAKPAWKGSVTTTTAATDQWWTAGGVIGTARVREHVESPPRQAFSWTPSTNITGDWALAVKTSPQASGSVHYLFDEHVTTNAEFRYSGGTFSYNNGGSTTSWPGGTAANYHVISRRAAVNYWYYWSGTAVATQGSHNTTDNDLITTGAWRGNVSINDNLWTPAVTRGVVWESPTSSEIRAMAPFVLGSVTNGVTAIIDGDLPVYPLIQLNGPITGPILTNMQTGGTINLTGLTLGSAGVAIIDLRTGDKTLTDAGGNNLLGSVTTLPVSMAYFYLAPAPAALEGYNVIQLTGGSVGTAATMSVQYTNEYMSY